MCGIAGIIHSRVVSRDHSECAIRAMIDQLSHRGPNDSGIWLSDDQRVLLGHRRLSIIDLSSQGHQPMHSPSGRYVLTYNGEIYNFQNLRQALQQESYSFAGHSDSEVLLIAIECWGLEATLKKLIGMFALAVWDRQTRQCHLVRDRLGIKPLYYAFTPKGFIFASELKAITAYKDFTPTIDRNVLGLYVRYGYVPAPYSLYQQCYKLEPGHKLTISIDAMDANVKSVAYWSHQQLLRHTDHLEEGEALQQLKALLRDAVKQRMVSDVPIGCFLSGGIDSSLVTALMQEQSHQAVKTFSIGYECADYNEANYARQVAKQLGTDHHEQIVTAKDAQAVIPHLSSIYSEPFSDSSQIPMYLVSKLAKQSVTVCLSGDGGDELFAGYNRYHWGNQLWRYSRELPRFLRQLIKGGIHGLSPKQWDRLGACLPKAYQQRQWGDKLYKVANALSATHADALYLSLTSRWQNPTALVRGSEAINLLSVDYALPDEFNLRMMYYDLMTYLPDDILCKVDRASMAVGLEARVPLLDHRLVEFAWHLPAKLRCYPGKSKYLLRKLLSEYISQDSIERPKMGFAIPIGDWLRGPLRDWAETLLDKHSIEQQGYFDSALIDATWQAHLSGKRNHQSQLWTVLMFQDWLAQQ